MQPELFSWQRFSDPFVIVKHDWINSRHTFIMQSSLSCTISKSLLNSLNECACVTQTSNR